MRFFFIGPRILGHGLDKKSAAYLRERLTPLIAKPLQWAD